MRVANKIVCPHCGHNYYIEEDEDLWNYEGETLICLYCLNSFFVAEIEAVTYITTK